MDRGDWWVIVHRVTKSHKHTIPMSLVLAFQGRIWTRWWSSKGFSKERWNLRIDVPKNDLFVILMLTKTWESWPPNLGLDWILVGNSDESFKLFLFWFLLSKNTGVVSHFLLQCKFSDLIWVFLPFLILKRFFNISSSKFSLQYCLFQTLERNKV